MLCPFKRIECVAGLHAYEERICSKCPEWTGEMSTIEAHRKLTHRRARRLEITKGTSRGERIRRVNKVWTKRERK